MIIIVRMVTANISRVPCLGTARITKNYLFFSSPFADTTPTTQALFTVLNSTASPALLLFQGHPTFYSFCREFSPLFTRLTPTFFPSRPESYLFGVEDLPLVVLFMVP